MRLGASIDSKAVIGRPLDRLTLQERIRLAGKFVALALYDPKTLPLRRIEAIGDSTEECLRLLEERGLDPRDFEFQRLAPPY